MTRKKSTYPAPVDLLLVYGEPRTGDWHDYLSLGFTDEHIPDLIRMALDPELHWAETENSEVYAPIHAWRALGQLRAEAAIEPLFALFTMFEDDGGSDWVSDELPTVYAMIGAAAIPALSTYLLDEAHDLYPRDYAASALRYIAEMHPDFRAQAITPIVAVLEKFEHNDPILNADMINQLMDLKALETLPLMERAFAADAVDLMMQGDWEDVQIEMGVKYHRDTERPPLFAQFEPMLKMMEMIQAQTDFDPNDLDDFDLEIGDANPDADKFPLFPSVTPMLDLMHTLEDRGTFDPRNERQRMKKAEAKAKAKRKQAAKSRKINNKKRKK